MLRLLHFVLRLLIALYVTATCFTQAWPQLPVFRNYNTEHGLPSSETYCIEQDSRGYIYIGTDRGLARFDGRRFDILTTKDGLTSNVIFSLQPMKDKMWYYTQSSLIGYIQGDTIHDYRYNHVIRQLVHSGHWTLANADENNRVHIGKRRSSGYELFAINTDGTVDRSLSVPLKSNYVHVYALAKKFWLKTGPDSAGKVKIFSLDTKKLLGEIEIDKGPKPDMETISGHHKGNTTWLVYKDIYCLKNNVSRKVISNPVSPLQMTVDRNENIWLGYEHKGVMLYLKKNGYSNPVHLLGQYSVSGILEDREGGFWFTTLENGVYYLPPEFVPAYDQRTGLSAAKVTQIKLLGKDAAVLQSDYSVSLIRNKDAGRTTKLFDDVFNMVSGNDGRLYLADWNKNAGTSKAVSLNCYKVFFAGHRIWACGTEEMLSIDPQSTHKEVSVPLNIPYVICAREISDTQLLLGTLDGLYLYQNHQLSKLHLGADADRERICTIENFDDRHLLVATSGKGILILDKRSFALVRQIIIERGQRSICNVVRRDANGVVWAGTNMGLYKIEHILDKARTSIQWTAIHDGIVSNEINDICIVGEDLWLGTAKGISVFPRNKRLAFGDSIPVLIQKLTVNGKPLTPAAGLQLEPDGNSISISFIGLNYRYANVLQYQYRLLGNGNDAWNYTSTPVVNYNGLPPGNYVFEYGAMAPNHYGKVYTATYAFSIAPPFWLSWWFIALSVLAIAYGIGLFIHYRVKYIRKQGQLRNDLGSYRDKALRDQMSPHFIYNSLNTIQNYILKHDTSMSVSFLSKFSRLMRLTFNNTVQDVITIQKDLEALRLYTEMERMRFPGKLTFHLPENLPEQVQQALVPPLLLQPFIENAVLHGLLPLNTPGNIWLSIEQAADSICVEIRDDGIGRAAAAKIKSKKQAYLGLEESQPGFRKYSGATITIDRIMQTWGKFPGQSRFRIIDLFHPDGTASGTCIQFYLPLNYDKSNNSRRRAIGQRDHTYIDTEQQ